jgi:hypothetical protein
VAGNLAGYARALLDLLAGGLPTLIGLVNEPTLLHRFNVAIHTEPYGPRRFHGPVVDYLIAEARLGRVAPGHAGPAATLLVGSMIMITFGRHFGARPDDRVASEIDELVATLVAGLAPRPADDAIRAG